MTGSFFNLSSPQKYVSKTFHDGYDRACVVKLEAFSFIVNREGENKILFDTVTNEDGRINEEFILTSDDCLCNFEMIVKIGDYFSNYSEKNSNKIVSEIVIRINMKSNDKKYHIPLIISPNSYSTWWSK